MAFVFHSCTKAEDSTPLMPEPEEVIEMPKPGDTLSVAYLALGDSYTIGQGVPEKERYPSQLVDSLERRGLKVRELKIVAQTGWTTRDLSSALSAHSIKDGDFNLVSLLIGVNNQYRGSSLEGYEREFAALLDRAITYAGGNKDRIFVLSIPDYSVTPFGQIYGNPQRTAEEIDRFNAVNQAIAKERGVRYFDITPISRQALSDRSLIAPDNLHPSGKMYTRWVEFILPELVRLLKK